MKKLMTFAFTLVLTSVAQAMIQAPGTFIPSQCGVQTYESGSAASPQVAAVCVGEIVGETSGDRAVDQVVVFRMEDGSLKKFRVDSSANFMIALRSGNVKSMLHLVSEAGETATMKVVQTRDGSLVSASGHVSGAGYFVPSFETMFTIQ